MKKGQLPTCNLIEKTVQVCENDSQISAITTLSDFG